MSSFFFIYFYFFYYPKIEQMDGKEALRPDKIDSNKKRVIGH